MKILLKFISQIIKRSFNLFFPILLCLTLFSPFHFACKKSNSKDLLTQDSTIYSKFDFTSKHLDSHYIREFFNNHCNFQIIESELLSFYRRRDFQLAWYTDDGISESVQTFFDILREYNSLFNDTSFNIEKIEVILDSARLDSNYLIKNNERIPQLELTLTSSFFIYAKKAYGGIDKDPKDLEWFIPRKKKDFNLLLNAVSTGRKDFNQFEPVNVYYKSLKFKLAELHRKEKELDSLRFNLIIIDNIPCPEMIKADMVWFEFLKIENDLEKLNCINLNDHIFLGIKNYQLRHGLKPTGNIDSITFKLTQNPTQYYMEKMMVNLERLRWLSDTMPNEFILVNIPDFKMHVFDSSKLKWSCAVVVGKTIHQTSIFTGNLKHIVFSPYWSVPVSIANKEFLPKLKLDRQYLNKNDMELLSNGKVISSSRIRWNQYKTHMPFTIRQKPGKLNALGKVKFLFPNSYSIYLHDTPAKALFSENRRDFSHGCIRVSEPLKLAQYLLRNDRKYNAQTILGLTSKSNETWVNLAPTIPVLILYLTTWVDSKGILNFRNDLYMHDQKLKNEIFIKR